MKFKPDERGFVLAEFAIALPLLILLLYSLGIVTVQGLNLSHTQSADYALETEAQYVLDRITTDARAAHSVEVRPVAENIEEIFFIYHVNQKMKNDPRFYDFIEQRRYTVYSPEDPSSPKRFFKVYAERKRNGQLTNPISGDNFYGKTFVKELKFTNPSENVLHIKLKIQLSSSDSNIDGQIVEFNTSVYMPVCESFKKVHGE